MLLSAVVSKDELVLLIESFTPMRVTIDERRGRVVTLGRPRAVQLVPEMGLRVRGDAHIAWDVAGVGIPVTIQSWQILLVPRIAPHPRSGVLSFDPVIEELALKLVPGFLDDKIADAIRDGVEGNRERLAWNFARSLSKRLPLPARISPAGLFELRVLGGTVSVSESALRLDVRLEARVEQRAPARAEEQEPRSARFAPVRAHSR